MQNDNFPQRSRSSNSFISGDGNDKNVKKKKKSSLSAIEDEIPRITKKRNSILNIFKKRSSLLGSKPIQPPINYTLFIKNKESAYLDRIAAALKYYDIVGKDKFIDFCSEYYSSQCLNDYMKFLKEHRNDSHEIATKYGIKCGSIDNCEHTRRHMRNRRKDSNKNEQKNDDKSDFYIRIFDQIHFALCHLKESGYRLTYQHSDEKSDNDNDNDDQFNNTDVKTLELMKEIRSKVLKSERNSKFNIVIENVENVENIAKKIRLTDANKTFMDCLKIHVYYQTNANILSVRFVFSWMKRHNYDSDSIKLDVKKKYGNFAKSMNAKINKIISDFMATDTVHSTQFSTGFVFFYWPYFKNINEEQAEAFKNKLNRVGENHNDYRGWPIKDLYIEPYFESMKQEVLESGFFSYNGALIWENSIMTKAKMYIENNVCKQMQCIHGNQNGWYKTEDPLCFGIKFAELLHLEHLIALILYCDYTDFSCAFSAVFRKNYWLESIKSVKKRHRRFHHIAKRLNEMVCYFGFSGHGTGKYNYLRGEYKDKITGPFYCGMDRPLNIGKFAIRLNGPVSTSMQREVAMRFCGENGVILQFNNTYAKKEIFMDCSWLSQFGFEEAEMLFIRGRYKLKLESIKIRDTSTKKWHDYRIYNHAFYLFHHMISGAWPQQGIKVTMKSVKIMRGLIYSEMNELYDEAAVIDDYIRGNFKLFVENTTQIVLNLHDMDKYINNEEFVGLIMNKVKRRKVYGEDDFNLFKEEVLSMFVNLKEIIIYTSYGKAAIYAINIFNLLNIACSNALPSSLKKIIVKDCALNKRWLIDECIEIRSKVNRMDNLIINSQTRKGPKGDEDWMVIDISFDEATSPKSIDYNRPLSPKTRIANACSALPIGTHVISALSFTESLTSPSAAPIQSEDDYLEDFRSSLEIGNEVLIFCKSQEERQEALIWDIYQDEKEDYLELFIENNGTVKEVSRFSTDIVAVLKVDETRRSSGSSSYYFSDIGYFSKSSNSYNEESDLSEIQEEEKKLLAQENDSTLPSIPKICRITEGESSVEIELDCDNYLKLEIESAPETLSKRFTQQLSVSFSKLINGKTYTFRARAINEFGKSQWCKWSKAVTPLKEPPQPTSLRCIPYKKEITLFWVCAELNSPEYQGWYEVESDPKTFRVVTNRRRARFVYDIKNGTKYRFKVFAVNKVGRRRSKQSKVCIPRHDISEITYERQQVLAKREMKKLYKDFQIQEKKKKARENLRRIQTARNRRKMQESHKQIRRAGHKSHQSETLTLNEKRYNKPNHQRTQSSTVSMYSNQKYKRQQNRSRIPKFGQNEYTHPNRKAKSKKPVKAPTESESKTLNLFESLEKMKRERKEVNKMVYEDKLAQLFVLGHYDEDKNIAALVTAEGDLKKALNILRSGN